MMGRLRSPSSRHLRPLRAMTSSTMVAPSSASLTCTKFDTGDCDAKRRHRSEARSGANQVTLVQEVAYGACGSVVTRAITSRVELGGDLHNTWMTGSSRPG